MSSENEADSNPTDDKKTTPAPVTMSLRPQSKFSGSSKSRQNKQAEQKKIEQKQPTAPTTSNPLHQAWSMHWESGIKSKGTKVWGADIKKIMDFSTVEDFWSLYNNLAQPTNLANRSNFHLFKSGIAPTWEDSANAHGGHWVISFATTDVSVINRSWLWLILGLIGEQFPDGESICGIVMKVNSKSHRMQLWMRGARETDAILRTGQTIKDLLETSVSMAFKPHHQEDSGVSHVL